MGLRPPRPRRRFRRSGDPTRHIRVGERDFDLPAGVSLAEWSLERRTRQNPRIRTLLGSIRLLEGVLESNYALLHCSPDRLCDIWDKVRRVAAVIRSELAPLLTVPSPVPRLEAARQDAETSLQLLETSVLVDLDRFPERIPDGRLLDLRKALCVSIGQLHAFLQDTFGELMTADPRSLHDADYFLSRRFPRDIEEAEWLLATVERLEAYVELLLAEEPSPIELLVAHLERRRTLPDGAMWAKVEEVVEEVRRGLVPRLKEVLALRGIRFEELEIVDRYAAELPSRLSLLVGLHEAGREALQEAAGEGVAGVEAVLAGRLAAVAEEVEGSLQDLKAFVPLWLCGIEKRRALMLRRSEESLAARA